MGRFGSGENLIESHLLRVGLLHLWRNSLQPPWLVLTMHLVSDNDFDPVDLRGQERQKADQADKERFDQATEADDLKWLLSSQQGRRIAWRWLDQAGVFQQSFSPNALTMAFKEGNRNLGNRLLGQIMDTCPEMFPVILREAGRKKDKRNARTDDAADHSN